MQNYRQIRPGYFPSLFVFLVTLPQYLMLDFVSDVNISKNGALLISCVQFRRCPEVTLALASFTLHQQLLIHQPLGYQLTSNVQSYQYRRTCTAQPL